MNTKSLGSCSGSFLQPRRLLEECPEQNLQIGPAEMIKPLSSPRQQEGHFRNSVSDGGSPRGALPIPSDRPVIPMTSQNTHGVGVVYPAEMIKPFSSSQQQEGHFRNSVSDSVPIPSDRPMMPKIQCPCGSGTCIVKTSHTEKNPNRLFYKCPAEIVNSSLYYLLICERILYFSKPMSHFVLVEV